MAILGSHSAPPNSIPIRYTYDAFLSFRGEDTRHHFTATLYRALRRKGVNAFIDDKKLGKGKRISTTLLRAIERSRLSVVVFSENYATSTWCLEELVKIVECNKEKNQPLCPIFYKVEPSDVRLQRKSYEVAMAGLEERFRDDVDKVRKWRLALSEAASMSGWYFQDGIGYVLLFLSIFIKKNYVIFLIKPTICRLR